MKNTLTDEQFNRIYTDKKFRNCVATAHYVCDSKGNPRYKQANDYPAKWEVTQEQIEAAKTEIKAAKSRTILEHKGELILIGMGWAGAAVNTNDVGNCRVRGYFLNDAGVKCFVEANHRNTGYTNNEDWLWFDFAHFCDKYKEDGGQHHLLRNVEGAEYTKANILRYVNQAFGASFKKVFVDNYDLNPDDHISEMI